MTERAHPHAGFTLIELLVVIGIVALLAALLLPAMNTGFKKADMARAKSEMKSIVAAVSSFAADYNRMPTQSDSGPDKTFGGKDRPEGERQYLIINSLRGGIAEQSADKPDNPRRTLYLEVPEDAMKGTDRKGATYTAADGFYLDPWGSPYYICLDFNSDNAITFNYSDFPAVHNVAFPGVQVAVISAGPDVPANQVTKEQMISTLW